MKTLASCVLISAAIACVVMAHGRLVRQSPVREERNSSLRSEWIVHDPIASPPARHSHRRRSRSIGNLPHSVADYERGLRG
jgi:hypothetical protein